MEELGLGKNDEKLGAKNPTPFKWNPDFGRPQLPMPPLPGVGLSGPMTYPEPPQIKTTSEGSTSRNRELDVPPKLEVKTPERQIDSQKESQSPPQLSSAFVNSGDGPTNPQSMPQLNIHNTPPIRATSEETSLLFQNRPPQVNQSDAERLLPFDSPPPTSRNTPSFTSSTPSLNRQHLSAPKLEPKSKNLPTFLRPTTVADLH